MSRIDELRKIDFGAFPVPVDKKGAEDALGKCFRTLMSQEIPRIVWARNPRDAFRVILNAAYGAAYDAAYGAARCTTVRDAARDAAYGAAYGAARCAAYGAAYDAARDAARCTTVRGAARDAIFGAARDVWIFSFDAFLCGVGYYWILRKGILILPRPAIKTAENNLHSDGGAAVEWPGEQYHFLWGVRVSREVAETPAELLDPKLAITEKNAEVRAAICRKIGIDRVVEKLGAKVIHKMRVGNLEYELLNLAPTFDRGRDFWPYLKMPNPSVPGKWHIEGVDAGCRTVEDALLWRNGADVDAEGYEIVRLT